MPIDVRRSLDVAVSLMGMPILAFMAAAAFVTIREPRLFRQQRLGLKGKPFTIIKFRTMNEDQSLPSHMRITPTGRLWRSSGFDEWPQLLCILKGDMSLIGPRPCSLEVNEAACLFTTKDMWGSRYDIKPGLIPSSLVVDKIELKYKVGSAAYYEAVLKADLAYASKRQAGRALGEDLRLLWAALGVVLARRVDPQGKSTAQLPTAPRSSVLVDPK